MLQNWPYHERGQLAIRQLCEKVTCLNTKDVSDTHALLTVHRYASQEHAYKKTVSVYPNLLKQYVHSS